MKTSRLGTLVLAVAGFIGPASSARAQRVIGQIIDRDTGAPIQGAFATLLDTSGRRVHAALSDSAGRFLLAAPAAGTFIVTTERIGHETTRSAPLDLATGETRAIRVLAGTRAISLEGIAVHAGTRCEVRPAAARAAARVWNEVSKALSLTLWSRENRQLTFRSTRYVRERDPSHLNILDETRNVSFGRGVAPFKALPEAELLRDGFARQEGDSTTYFGPDAATLLSDAFLDNHCFELVAGEDETQGLIGLRFRPIPSRKVPEIEGVLWLDPASARLTFVDYDYVHNRRLTPAGNVGGHIAFEQLPSGAWIVSDWWIRMPSLVRTGDDFRVASIREAGGVTLSVREHTGPVAELTGTAILKGTVTDGTRNAPLAGAEVTLPGTRFATRTDARGAFTLRGLPPGRFIVAFTHPRTDSIPVELPTPIVRLVNDSITGVALSIPPAATIADHLCADDAVARMPGAPPGLLWGFVDDATGKRLAGVQVLVSWNDVIARTDAGTVVTFQGGNRSAETDARGRYHVCGVPSGHIPIDVHAERAGSESIVSTLVLGPALVVRFDLRLAAVNSTR